MAHYGAPPKTEYKVLPPDVYEAAITGIEEIENVFYNPVNDDPKKATQLKWTAKVREPGSEGVTLTMFSGAYFSRHKRNKLANWCRVLDPAFDIDVCYSSEEEFRSKMIGAPFRVAVKNKEVEKDGETRVYNEAAGDLLPSKLSPLTKEELDAILLESLGATPVAQGGGGEIPF